ncbi:type I polyketide synthase [Burkholderia stagnalis]|uniref:type I polyketide synthase n=1 Tax=Burkholderia stagnalis TaxID=1503054 RepID=UPI000F80FC7D|nr:type I polyketide synthase [Burkholderia stagnalis]
MEQVALIGSRLRLPGADSVDAFWQNVLAGRDCIASLSDAELLDAGADPAALAQPDYVRRAGVLDDIDRFDYRFFGYTFREAQAIDPQQRVLLTLAHALLEQVGAAHREIGVYVSVGFPHYLLNNLMNQPPGRVPLSDVVFGNSGDCAATRIAYKLDLHGPAMSIQSGCSSALQALHTARVAILTGQCQMALVGGAAIRTPQKEGYLYQRDGVLAKDGVCRPFDARATGTVFTNGAIVLALKALSAARRDGDDILGVIRGSAINNDGQRKSGFTAPSVAGQGEAIRRAYERSGIAPATIGYLETHGTGTALGDPIEIQALKDVYGGSGADAHCALGSVKANIGHTDVAAGLVGVLKAALCLKHQVKPPLAGFAQANPNLALEAGPFYIPTAPEPWAAAAGQPRRAAVSALGVGGSNAHVILEEAPGRDLTRRVDAGPLLISAQTLAALASREQAVERALAGRTLALGDARYTSQLFQRHYAEKRALVFGRACADPIRVAPTADWRHAQVALLFPGQGNQFPGMGRALYERGGHFRAVFDDCAERFVRAGCTDPRALLNAGDAEIRDTAALQPYLFTLEYALGATLLAMRLPVAAMVGHSLGEYVAATLAGVFDLADAVPIVAARARIMSRAPRGAMLAVLAAEEQVGAFLHDGLSLCVVNSDTSCVVGGTEQDIDALAPRLAAARLHAVRLPTSHAFHSYLMEASSREFAAAFDGVALHAPRWPIVSNLDGRADLPERFATAAYWVDHLRRTVRFNACLATLAALVPSGAWVEAGPGRSIANALARLALPDVTHFPTVLPDDEAARLDTLLAQCWANGMAVDWAPLYGATRGNVVPLAPHPLDEISCWIDAPAKREAVAQAPAYRKQDDLDQWFYAYDWAPLPDLGAVAARAPSAAPVLLIGDGSRLAERLAERLAGTLAKQAGEWVVLDGSRPDALEAALRQRFAKTGDAPARGAVTRVVVVAPAQPQPGEAPGVPAGCAHLCADMLSMQRTFNTLRAAVPGTLDITLVAVADAPGGDAVPSAGAAWVDSFATVVQQEFPRVTCRAIHVDAALLDADADADAAPDAAGLLADACLHASARFIRVERDRLVERKLCRSGPRPGDGPAQATALSKPPRTVLIVGGVGNVGMIYAAFFSIVVGADVAIVSRHATAFATTLREPSAASDRAVRRRKGLFDRMVAAGHRIEFVDADATDPRQLERAAHAVAQALGPIDLVVHAAGAPADMHSRPFAETDAAYLDALVAPKLAVCANLHALTGALRIPRVMIVSSISATLGGIGLFGYAASHGLLNAYARSASRADCQWTVIDWDAWEFFKDTRDESNDDIGIDHYAISEQEGLSVLERLAAQGWPAHVIVASGDLVARYRNWVLSERDETPDVRQAVAPRPQLKDDMVPPRTRTEQALAALWGECIGVEPVGIRDNFFELGGHSLIALKLIDRINQTLDWDLSAVDMFKFPTIERLAEAREPEAARVVDEAGEEDRETPAVPAADRRTERLRRNYYQSRKHGMESKIEQS